MRSFQGEQNLEKGDIPVILFCWRSDHRACGVVSPIIDEISKEREDVVILRFNAKKHHGLVEKYDIGIKDIPSLFIFLPGNKSPQKKINGIYALGKEEINEAITAAISENDVTSTDSKVSNGSIGKGVTDTKDAKDTKDTKDTIDVIDKEGATNNGEGVPDVHNSMIDKKSSPQSAKAPAPARGRSSAPATVPTRKQMQKHVHTTGAKTKQSHTNVQKRETGAHINTHGRDIKTKSTLRPSRARRPIKESKPLSGKKNGDRKRREEGEKREIREKKEQKQTRKSPLKNFLRVLEESLHDSDAKKLRIVLEMLPDVASYAIILAGKKPKTFLKFYVNLLTIVKENISNIMAMIPDIDKYISSDETFDTTDALLKQLLGGLTSFVGDAIPHPGEIINLLAAAIFHTVTFGFSAVQDVMSAFMGDMMAEESNKMMKQARRGR